MQHLKPFIKHFGKRMGKRNFLTQTLFLTMALLFAATPLVLANGGGYSYGVPNHGSMGLFQPSHTEQVEMKTEKLTIDLHYSYAMIDVEYSLHNSGKAVTVEAAFPCAGSSDETWQAEKGSEEKPREKVPLFREFAIDADGKPLPWRFAWDPEIPGKPRPANVRKGSDGDGDSETELLVPCWYIFQVDFGPDQTRKLHARYITRYYGTVRDVSDDSYSSAPTLTYLFSTAAIWGGPIGEGEVVINAVAVDPDEVVFNLPKRFTRQGKSWTWQFKNFEPTLADDLKLAIRPARDEFWRTEFRAKESDPEKYFRYVETQGRWELHHQKYSVKASATLAGGNYRAENVQDGNRETAWAEGEPDDGMGESLTLTLNKPGKVTAIGILNGYQKSPELFKKNNRVAEFKVSVNGGKSFSVSLPDEGPGDELFYFKLPGSEEPVRTIQLTILKAYPGSQYRETCISEILLVSPLKKKPEIRHCR